MSTGKLRRYPGVKPFEISEQDLFFGRNRDVEDLLDLIWLEKLVIMFGKSGYGKSSLLNAGIIPEIQSEAITISVRLGSYQEGQKKSPTESLRLKINEVVSNNPESDFLDNLDLPDSLWRQIKRKQTKEIKQFVFLFDQFEEFFTYSIADQRAFKTQVAEVLYTEVPQYVRDLNDSLNQTEQRFLANAFDVRVVFVIRSDRMSLLDSMKDKLPGILHNRFELRGLSSLQAIEAITKPALMISERFITPVFEYTQRALEKIIGELSNNKNKTIEAFQVQIVCEEIENEVNKGKVPDRNGNGSPDVDLENLPNFDNLYENYYQRKLKELDTRVQYAAQKLIEEKLIFEDSISGEARRLSIDSGVLLHDTTLDKSLLHQLENMFLVRRETTSTGGHNYEVSHDTLIGPILRVKAERIAKEQLEFERLEARKKRNRLVFIMFSTILALTIVIGIGLYTYRQNIKLNAALERAESETNKAEKALNDFLAAQKAKEIIEFEQTLKDAESILNGGNCPPNEMIEEIEEMRKKYHEETDLQEKISSINNQIENCKSN
ncbi:MAG: hypothetical protein DHS20C18_38120 [Saprospiraceae bacterium]|nr:MAG: hypothetical protein DHS20C18_38120 [Saprospiraceae bacterium]